MLTFTRHAAGRSDRISLELETLVIAGWAGRDEAAIQHHIHELAAIGVPPPSSVPVLEKPRKIQVGTETTSPGSPATVFSPFVPQRKVQDPRWIMNTSAVKWTWRLFTVPGGMAATPRLKPCASVRFTT